MTPLDCPKGVEETPGGAEALSTHEIAMMKTDERYLLLALWKKSAAESVRDRIGRMAASGAIVPKRAWFLLRKWAHKGWYDYGVTLDLGQLTQAGTAVAQRIAQAVVDGQGRIVA